MATTPGASKERALIDRAQEAVIRFIAALRDMEQRGATGSAVLELNLSAGKISGVAKVKIEEHKKIELVGP